MISHGIWSAPLDVYDLLKSPKPNKSPGSDGLQPHLILQKLAGVLDKPHLLCQIPWRRGNYHETGNQQIMLPIFKKGNKNDQQMTWTESMQVTKPICFYGKMHMTTPRSMNRHCPTSIDGLSKVSNMFKTMNLHQSISSCSNLHMMVHWHFGQFLGVLQCTKSHQRRQQVQSGDNRFQIQVSIQTSGSQTRDHMFCTQSTDQVFFYSRTNVREQSVFVCSVVGKRSSWGLNYGKNL